MMKTTTIKKLAKQFDILAMASIFAIVGIYIWSWFTNYNSNGSYYWYAIQSAIEHLLCSVIIFWLAMRLKTCKYTKIMTLYYLGINIVSTAYAFIDTYYNTFIYIGIGLTASMLILIIQQLLYNKLFKK